MKIIKLDGRYAGGSKWKFAIQFAGTAKQSRTERTRYQLAFRRLYGNDRELNPDKTVPIFSREWYLWNENWRLDLKHNRIYFNNEGDVSAVLLVIDQ